MATLNLSILGPGTFTLDDDGIPGNGQSVVRDASGAIILTFGHPSPNSLTIVSAAGQNLIFNITDSFGASNVTVGNLFDPAQCPDSIQVRNIGATTGAVVLASNGALTELGSDAAPDIVAGSVVLSAPGGVGTAANAIETQTAAIEAQAVTGGINIGNFGAVTIGGLSSAVAGLQVVTSGDIRFTSHGSITLADFTSFNTVQGGASSGNVILIATGYDFDFTSKLTNNSIRTPEGSIEVRAGRDILLGTTPPNFDNNLFAKQSITLAAGRDVTLAGDVSVGSSVSPSNEVTGAGVVVTAGRDISVTGPSASIGASGFETNGIVSGDVVLTAGEGGSVILSAGSFPALYSTSGNVIVNADRMLIGANIGAGGSVTIRPVTAGRAIDLGSLNDSAFALELSSSELGRIRTGTPHRRRCQ